MSAFGWLVTWAVAATLAAVVCGWQWASAGARSDARAAERDAAAAIAGADRYAAGVAQGAGIADGFRHDTAEAIADAAMRTGSRGVQIVRVPTTGACVMPSGLPALAGAVEEARDAAR